MIKTKSVKDPVEASDGDRILVMRYWPRPFSKGMLQLTAWVKAVAPSRELLAQWYQGEISWQGYTIRYQQEMSEQRESIQALAEKAKMGTLTLLCQEPESVPHCHRHLLKAMIEEVVRSS